MRFKVNRRFALKWAGVWGALLAFPASKVSLATIYSTTPSSEFSPIESKAKKNRKAEALFQLIRLGKQGLALNPSCIHWQINMRLSLCEAMADKGDFGEAIEMLDWVADHISELPDVRDQINVWWDLAEWRFSLDNRFEVTHALDHAFYTKMGENKEILNLYKLRCAEYWAEVSNFEDALSNVRSVELIDGKTDVWYTDIIQYIAFRQARIGDIAGVIETIRETSDPRQFMGLGFLRSHIIPTAARSATVDELFDLLHAFEVVPLCWTVWQPS